MSDCLFCKIFAGEIPSTKVYANEKVYAFKDLYPQAKEHYLFISKNHSHDLTEMDSEDIVDVMEAIKIFTKETKLNEKGFRVVSNIGSLAGQSVFHTHFHVLAGEKLKGFGA